MRRLFAPLILASTATLAFANAAIGHTVLTVSNQASYTATVKPGQRQTRGCSGGSGLSGWLFGTLAPGSAFRASLSCIYATHGGSGYGYYSAQSSVTYSFECPDEQNPSTTHEEKITIYMDSTPRYATRFFSQLKIGTYGSGTHCVYFKSPSMSWYWENPPRHDTITFCDVNKPC